MKEKEYCCDCRAWSHYLIVGIGGAFFLFTLLAAIAIGDCRIFGIAAIAFGYTCYFMSEMINKRVYIEENMLVVRNLWRNEKRYKISDISKVIIENNRYSAYISIKVAGEKIVIRKSQNRYYVFVEELFRRLKITGYSRGGKRVIDINK